MCFLCEVNDTVLLWKRHIDQMIRYDKGMSVELPSEVEKKSNESPIPLVSQKKIVIGNENDGEDKPQNVEIANDSLPVENTESGNPDIIIEGSSRLNSELNDLGITPQNKKH